MSQYAYFELYPSDAGLSNLYIRELYGEGKVQQKGGDGAWEAVARPFLPSLTIWKGPKEPLSLVIPMMFEGWTIGAEGSSVEPAITKLEQMAGIQVDVSQPPPKPPTLILNGFGALPHDFTLEPARRWVLGEIEWDEAIRRESDGARVRQKATITVMSYKAPDDLERKPSAAKVRTAKARSGDTFHTIAQRVLKHAQWGTRLASLNEARNANQKLRAGETVLLPSPTMEREWKSTKRR